jgi:hypothetical protein
MKIGGHGLGDHIRLLGPLLVLMAAVWALRIVLYAAGAPPFVLHVVSVTLAGAACTLLVAIMIHSRRFGSYTSVVAAVFLLSCWQQLLISAAILFTALTGLQNVYSAPEFSFGQNLWGHIAGHLTFGIGSGAILGAVMGCAVFWMLRKADRMQGGRAVSGR